MTAATGRLVTWTTRPGDTWRIFEAESIPAVEPGVHLREWVDDALCQGHRRLLLNLSGFTMLDAALIGEVVRALIVSRLVGGRIALVLTPRTRELFVRTNLLPLFEHFSSNAEALAGHSPAGEELAATA